MSLFFDNQFALPQGETAIKSAWSNNDFNMILAIATDKPRVIFVNEEGTQLPNFEIQRGKTTPVCLKWHPVFQSLAIGWSDGCVTLWNEDQRMTREDKVLHKAPLSIITFSSDGSRMVTGDQKGTVGVWRTHRGLTQVCSYKKEGAVNQIVFCSLIMNQEQTDNSNSLFFFGGASGAVCLADDLKNCSEVCKVNGSVKSILFYEKENSVIIITSHLLLVQFKLNLSEKLVPDRKVKLAVSGNIDYLTTIWTGQGLLATVSGENMVRMFNIENDENYVLTLAESSFKG
jgi:intraflagellar transport protein 140